MNGISRFMQDFSSKGKDNFEKKGKVMVKSTVFRASYLHLTAKGFLLHMICELLDVLYCLTAQAENGCSEKGDEEHFPEQVNESWKQPQCSTEP